VSGWQRVVETQNSESLFRTARGLSLFRTRAVPPFASTAATPVRAAAQSYFDPAEQAMLGSCQKSDRFALVGRRSQKRSWDRHPDSRCDYELPCKDRCIHNASRNSE